MTYDVSSSCSVLMSKFTLPPRLGARESLTLVRLGFQRSLELGDLLFHAGGVGGVGRENEEPLVRLDRRLVIARRLSCEGLLEEERGLLRLLGVRGHADEVAVDALCIPVRVLSSDGLFAQLLVEPVRFDLSDLTLPELLSELARLSRREQIAAGELDQLVLDPYRLVLETPPLREIEPGEVAQCCAVVLPELYVARKGLDRFVALTVPLERGRELLVAGGVVGVVFDLVARIARARTGAALAEAREDVAQPGTRDRPAHVEDHVTQSEDHGQEHEHPLRLAPQAREEHRVLVGGGLARDGRGGAGRRTPLAPLAVPSLCRPGHARP